MERMTAQNSGLVVIDFQEKLVPKIADGELAVANGVRLVRAAQALRLPVFCTEQYPKGLGSTVSSLVELLPERWAKTSFSAAGDHAFLEHLIGSKISRITLTGIETHVCVAQTALDLLDRGLKVQVPADAVGSRSKHDWEFALRRLERAGAIVTTTEAVLFEWIESSDHPQFKTISSLITGFVPPVPSHS